MADTQQKVQVESTGPFPALLAAWIQLIVPQPCYDRFFLDFDFLNGESNVTGDLTDFLNVEPKA
jgi:hypothetical protein